MEVVATSATKGTRASMVCAAMRELITEANDS